MGQISLEEYLHDRKACAHCQETGNEEECVSTLLSREDNCIFYNAVLAYHLPNRSADEAFTPEEGNADAQKDFVLLQPLRDLIYKDKVLEYYIRSQRIVTQIRGIHKNDQNIWSGYYERYVAGILQSLKNGNNGEALNKIVDMLDGLEATNGRVICTWLTQKGLMKHSDLVIDSAFTVQHIDRFTKLGYWLWACPLVNYMEQSYRKNGYTFAIKAVRYIAQARANEIAYKMGKRNKGDFIGKLVRMFGESICYVLGAVLGSTVERKYQTYLNN